MKPTKDYLKNQYLDQEKSIRQIASELGVAMATIQRWLKKYDIPARPMGSYVRTPEMRQAIADKRQQAARWLGESNPQWKGGTSTQRDGRVRYWANTVKRRDNNICQLCGLDGNKACEHCGQKPEMHADHIKPWAQYPELRFEISNGRTLCYKCHRSTLGKEGELLETPTG